MALTSSRTTRRSHAGRRTRSPSSKPRRWRFKLNRAPRFASGKLHPPRTARVGACEWSGRVAAVELQRQCAWRRIEILDGQPIVPRAADFERVVHSEVDVAPLVRRWCDGAAVPAANGCCHRQTVVVFDLSQAVPWTRSAFLLAARNLLLEERTFLAKSHQASSAPEEILQKWIKTK